MSSRLSDILDREKWSDAKVIDGIDGRYIEMSYATGCHNYAIGVSLAFFMATTLLAYAILWQDHLPEIIVQTAVPFFVVFSAIGIVVVAIAYVAPVWFYEFMENKNRK